ncbi:MAG: DUF1028 domain-containing protein [Gemmatimonas sp.]
MRAVPSLTFTRFPMRTHARRPLGRPPSFAFTVTVVGAPRIAQARHRGGKNDVTQGNILVGPEVIEAVAKRFEASEGTPHHLADRLITALKAGFVPGGPPPRDRTRKPGAARYRTKPHADARFPRATPPSRPMSMRRSLPLALFAGTLLLTPALAAAQQPTARDTARTAPAARPADVESIDAILRAVYDVISGPAGQARDWNRFRSLMAPGARLIPTGKQPNGVGVLRMWTAEDYIANAGPQLERSGFFEREIGRKLERYGNVVHLMSAYDSKRALSDPTPFARGVNSFQLFFDGTRWWVVTIYWEAETPGNPIPPSLLFAK